MLVRIVRLTFEKHHTDLFLRLFDRYKEHIRAYTGCLHLELWQDKHRHEVFTTYSLWDSEEALESYRASELFSEIWKQTKPLFAEKPSAYSSVRLIEL